MFKLAIAEVPLFNCSAGGGGGGGGGGGDTQVLELGSDCRVDSGCMHICVWSNAIILL